MPIVWKEETKKEDVHKKFMNKIAKLEKQVEKNKQKGDKVAKVANQEKQIK